FYLWLHWASAHCDRWFCAGCRSTLSWTVGIMAAAWLCTGAACRTTRARGDSTKMVCSAHPVEPGLWLGWRSCIRFISLALAVTHFFLALRDREAVGVRGGA